MGVLDGQSVDQAITNLAFINKNQNDVMPNQLGFSRTASGASIADIQAAVNKLYAATGASEVNSGTNYNATPSTIYNGWSYQQSLTALAGKFAPATGHFHTGNPGDGPQLPASGLAGQVLIAQGGTSANTASGAFNNLDPMSLIGDIIYEGASGQALALHAPTGASSRELLWTPATGATPGVPYWGPLLSSDIPGSVNKNGNFAQAAVTGAVAVTAPGNAQGFILMAYDTNSANLNWCVGAATASAASGMQLEPGRDTGYVPCAATVSICPVSGTQTYALQWILSS